MEENSLELASRWKRLWGACIDMFLATLILFATIFLAGSLGDLVKAQQVPFLSWKMLWWTALGMMVYSVLNGYFLATRGQSVGKIAMGTRIVDMNGQIPSLGKSLGLRNLVFQALVQIPYLGKIIAIADCLFIFDKPKRCLHDYLAGTQVIDIELTATSGIRKAASEIALRNGWDPKILVDIVSGYFSRDGIEIKYNVTSSEFKEFCSVLFTEGLLSKDDYDKLMK